MKLARVRAGTQVLLAEVDGTKVVPLHTDSGRPGDDPLRSWLAAGSPRPPEVVLSLADVQLLSPVREPQKIIAVGLNYRDHAAEQKKELPSAPMLFTKSPGAIVGPGDAITFRGEDSAQVDYEAELAVVIGRSARNVTVDEALRCVLGYTICNDVSARDAQKADGQYFRAKSFDTFCPLGPWIVTADEIPDPQVLAVQTRINGELRQDGTTADMVFPVAELIAYISQFMTLEPGDVIATGTPAGVGSGFDPPRFLVGGDVVEISIDGLGTLSNPVDRRN